MITLAIQQLSVCLDKKILFENINASFQAGEVWGILGSNGAGKTTLLHTIAGLLPIRKGDILLSGQTPISKLAAKKKARHLGILFQDSNYVFPQTVFDFCMTSRYPHSTSHQDHEIISNALHMMELSSYHDRLISNLSGGEKRRVNIAALLCQQPNIYLLDEPTNHLDWRWQIKILNLFRELATKKNITIVMILHDINLAAHYCDQIILLHEDGKVNIGSTKSTLTEANLSKLYGYPMICINETWAFNF